MTTQMPYEVDPYVLAHPSSLAFWEAAERDVLLLPKCLRCSMWHWYPRPFCPHCHADAVEWKIASGSGTVYAASALNRAPSPHVVAYVELQEGPRMLTNIVGCTLDRAVIGAPVVALFERSAEGRKVPVFRLQAS